MAQTKLSLLICHLPERADFINRLVDILNTQDQKYVEILFDPLPSKTIGEKRNRLLRRAKGEYLAFIDDDDRVSENYIELLMAGIDRGVDCCSLTGEITEDGLNPKKFVHSDRYESWFEKDNIYYRCVNHLNCIKKSIALQIGFPEKSHGEDHDYSKKLKASGLIKTEHWIDETIYFYDWRSKK